ncbi:CheR family methyltransferase [Fulvivirgaceae bacterium BMA12]|uniref:CheR family methyltransferase n=1 Tax=Agaribacillus aureus TaxID=3051825 RepID=A0ABT8L4R4_9BACT|nr:CheR family methyltransferase [Fulvivirgaceae bacterium BMA12]
MKIEISNEELNSLTAAIRKRHGIDFTCYEPKSLTRRVVRALSVFNLNSVHELWIKILRDRDFISLFINELSVGLTAMFRDPRFWIKLREILPEMISENGRLNVWHAGCSSGEEVYTFNIILRELALQEKVRSYATDMNTAAVEQAEKGIYHILKLDEYEHNYGNFRNNGSLSQYYERKGKYGHMDTKLIENVIFEISNLITNTNDGKYDIIFCRNVMIYFDAGAKQLVLDKFYNNLRPGGLLVIGFFDSLVPVINKSKFEFYDLNNKIFRKIP